MLIKSGQTTIFPNFDIENKKGCGILPIGSKVSSIYTTGLKWNLGDSIHQNGIELEMSTFVSTSNEIIGECVEIATSEPVIWCSSLKQFF